MSDPLRDVLELASREGALEGEGLEAFAEALRERARLVLAERVQSLEDRLKTLEAEVSWRRESMASLEAELSWRRESMKALEESVDSLGRQAEALTAELRRAQDAHGALLAHQRELVERVAAELLSVAALSPLRVREARRRLRALAGLLRVDSR
jgi:predicted  nucleic acid-binding Zn-ribbon protein